MNSIYYYETSVGRIGIVENGIAITGIRREPSDCPLPKDCVEKETPLIKKAAGQLAEYLTGKRREFDLPIAPEGTEFQKRTWRELCRIPYGQTRTYKQVAENIGCPKGFRAVGGANNRNPIMIVVPCHRVIGTDGSLTGYGGGLDMKEKLLKDEGAI